MRTHVTIFAMAAIFAQAAQSEPATEPQGPATYAIEATHTFATFEIGHFGTSTNRGRFDKKEGTVQLDRAAKTGKVEVTIDTASINTGTPEFDQHLKSGDFFNVAKFPTARFVGDKFSFNGTKVTAIGGTLTLLGKSLPATLKATNFSCYVNPVFKREVCGGDFETSIDRTSYGMDYGVVWGFPKDVRIVIQVEAIKQ